MTQKQYSGAAPVATLVGGITGTPTTFSVNNATGYPDGSIGPFIVDVDRNTPTEEKILCTSRAGNTFTIQTRAFDGTASSNHQNGASVEHVIDADTIQEANSHVNNTSRDDHSQYLNSTRHNNPALHTATNVIHGSTGALLNDDHTQYLRTDGGRAPTNHGVMYGTPVGFGAVNNGGISPLIAAADHIHKGGVIITTSARTGLVLANGDWFYETDTKQTFFYDGTTAIQYGGLPIGSISLWGGSLAPPAIGGWILADGSALSRATYSRLFAVYSTIYGAGDGSTTFNVPDLRSRVPVGAATAASGALTPRGLASVGGEETHILTAAEVAVHKHNMTNPLGNGALIQVFDAAATAGLMVGPTGNKVQGHSDAQTDNAGNSTAHNNMPPFIAITYIIKAL